MKKNVIFCDRDGVIVIEDQLDTYEKIIYIPHVFEGLRKIRKEVEAELVLVSNQDGVNTPSFPLDDFLPVHNRILETLKGEDIYFDEEFIDFSLPADNCSGRKPEIAMLKQYQNGEYDMQKSFMIGDRLTDMQLAKNLGCKGIWLVNKDISIPEEYKDVIALQSDSWLEISAFLTCSNFTKDREVRIQRKTKETEIEIDLNLDGKGEGRFITNIPFFDHMIEQIIKHSKCNLSGNFKGDLEIDEHHSVEDFALSLGSCFNKALGDKIGINRYGDAIVVMDEVVATCALDFSSRPDLVYDVDIKREYINNFPTEMVYHFFKSFSNEAKCNIYLCVKEGNAHHQVEALFKAFARAIKIAVKRIPGDNSLPSTKGLL